jgi:hypothetical protein
MMICVGTRRYITPFGRCDKIISYCVSRTDILQRIIQPISYPRTYVAANAVPGEVYIIALASTQQLGTGSDSLIPISTDHLQTISPPIFKTRSHAIQFRTCQCHSCGGKSSPLLMNEMTKCRISSGCLLLTSSYRVNHRRRHRR